MERNKTLRLVYLFGNCVQLFTMIARLCPVLFVLLEIFSSRLATLSYYPLNSGQNGLDSMSCIHVYAMSIAFYHISIAVLHVQWWHVDAVVFWHVRRFLVRHIFERWLRTRWAISVFLIHIIWYLESVLICFVVTIKSRVNKLFDIRYISWACLRSKVGNICLLPCERRHVQFLCSSVTGGS